MFPLGYSLDPDFDIVSPQKNSALCQVNVGHLYKLGFEAECRMSLQGYQGNSDIANSVRKLSKINKLKAVTQAWK